MDFANNDLIPTSIAATIRDGEPRYMVTTFNRRDFDYLRVVRGYEIVRDWDGQIGMLLVSRDKEEGHDARRREFSKVTLAHDIHKGKGGIIAELMAEGDLMKKRR